MASPKVTRPSGLDWREVESEASYVATSSPSHLSALATAVFALIWNGIFATLYASIFINWLEHGAVNWTLALVLIPFTAFGVFLGHEALTGLFNRTTIAVGNGEFRITRGPIPQRGNLRKELRDIAGFAVETWKDNENDSHHRVEMQMVDCSSVSLQALLYRDLAMARFVAQRLDEAVRRVRAQGHDGSTPPYR